MQNATIASKMQEWIQNAQNGSKMERLHLKCKECFKNGSKMQRMDPKCTEWIQNAKIASKMQIMVTKMQRMDPNAKID